MSTTPDPPPEEMHPYVRHLIDNYINGSEDGDPFISTASQAPVWKDVFSDEKEIRLFHDRFSETVAAGIRILAAGRRESERLVFNSIS